MYNMDIENMHPFCLPFGLCHDATSSTGLPTDSNSSSSTTSSLTSSSTSTTAHCNNNANSRPNETNIKEKFRNKTTSPTDELFKHLNHNCTPSSNSMILNDADEDYDGDSIIGSSSPHRALDLNGDDAFYSSLELSIDIGRFTSSSSSHNEIEFSYKTGDLELDQASYGDDDVDEDLKGSDLHNHHHHHHHSDWFSDQYLSLFSPIGTSSILNNQKLSRKSLNINRANYNGQVFHHAVVDPIDIKSSPTLAQLNLNSQDDPTEGLWDTSTTTTTITNHLSTNNSHNNHHNHHSSVNVDLLSNCTSINRINNRTSSNHLSCGIISSSSNSHIRNINTNSISSSSNINNNNNNNDNCISNNNCNNNLGSSCNLHQNNHTQRNLSYSHLLHSSSPLCHHTHHNQHQHNQGQSHQQHLSNQSQPDKQASPAQNAGLTGSHSFRKPTNSQNQNQHYSTSNCQLNSSGSISDGQEFKNLKPPANPNHIPLQNQSIANAATDRASNSLASSIDQQQQIKLASLQLQQRASSPALVTSSSSSLNSNLANIDNRTVDNKLKENIEYLTALLCKGNKLEQNSQPATNISSTMVRSYTTLAHSLSTGPKLLERQSPLAYNINSSTQITDQPATMAICPTNEAAPSQIDSNCLASSTPPQPNQHQLQLDQPQQPTQPIQQKPLQQQQQNSLQPTNNLKRAYSEQNWFNPNVESSVSAADSTDGQISAIKSGGVSGNSTPMNSCANYQPSMQVVNNNQQHNQRSSSEMMVLSSLLSHANSPNHQFNRQLGWEANWQDGHSMRVPMQVEQVQTIDAHQQQQQHQNKLATNTTKQDTQSSIPPNGRPITLTPIASNINIPKPKLSSVFAQPASPSASSTASSGGNVSEIGSSTVVMSTGPKKHCSSFQSVSSMRPKTSNRSARPNSLSTDCSLSSHDESFSSSQVDNDEYTSNRDSDDDDDDVDSDDESFYGDYTNNDLIGASISDDAENKWTLNMGRTRRNGQKRYFWQYNVQSKGPKGARICSAENPDDPFVLPEASDPVFSNDCQVEGVKHSGKARRGDGNDLTPNPRKLLMIGLELKKLGKIINDLAPVTDLPLTARNKTRKEKNKLASRACRLKKKAQHEANKIKLYGLQREHHQIVMAIYDIRKILNESAPNSNKDSLEPSIKSIHDRCSMNVAGQTSDYVNSVLEKVVSGCIDGGLEV